LGAKTQTMKIPITKKASIRQIAVYLFSHPERLGHAVVLPALSDKADVVDVAAGTAELSNVTTTMSGAAWERPSAHGTAQWFGDSLA